VSSNRTNIRGRQLPLVPTDGGQNAGDPCLVGQLAGVSMNGRQLLPGSPGGTPSDTSPQTIDTLGVYNLYVKGANAGGNVAVTAGDLIYYKTGVISSGTPYDSTHTPLSKDATGVLFGIALGPKNAPAGVGQFSGYAGGTVVASGATTAIDVRLGGVS